MKRPAPSRFLRDERGAVMVEFAITVTMLLILVFGIVDFGRALYTMNNLTQAAREGARYGAISRGTSETEAIKDTVVAHAATFGGITVAASNVTVTPKYGTGAAAGLLQYMQVQLSYDFVPITPIATLVGLGTITMRPSAIFRFEQGG